MTTATAALQARIEGLTWDVDFWTGIAQARFDSGDTRGNLDAVARMEGFWDEREDLRAELRSLQSEAA
ncbi:hypothetical protein [Methylobacterium indicum]|uniref:Uncharacterized protein n=1 Tax=Methylobacterium indicum TaxID=1775910 RepID=A0A8H9C6N5_9HYPH|nr:hypothetical protein [Methylobacterium indicum]BCM83555.1 hypothetical protein mvi_20160 [Methylobacterium indicum]